MTDKIYLYRIDEGELRQKIAEDFNIPLKDVSNEVLEFIEEFVKSKRSPAEYFKRQVEIPRRSDTSTLHLIIPKTYYFINIKKATWTIIGLLLDIFLTRGIALAFLSSLGAVGRCIARLSPKNGEMCCYLEALCLKKEGVREFTRDQLLERISGKECTKPEFACIHNKRGLCSISAEDLREVISSLENKSVITRTEDNRWRVEL